MGNKKPQYDHDPIQKSVLNLHKYTSHSMGEQKKVNEHIMKRLDGIESLQRNIVLKLYKMDKDSPKMVHLTSEDPQYAGECSTSVGNDENFIFEPR